MKPAAPLLPLLPALVVLPLAVVLPGLIHGGGWDLVGQFLLASLQPSRDPLVLHALFGGLGITVGMALLGWALSLLLGIPLGLLSSRLLWRSLVGTALPAELLRRLLPHQLQQQQAPDQFMDRARHGQQPAQQFRRQGRTHQAAPEQP